MPYRFAYIADDRLAAMAPPHWREKARRKMFERDRRQELVSGGLLAEMLGKSDFRVALTETGKPYLPDEPEIHFSISHSGDVVMCIVEARCCGCDVEKIVPLSPEEMRVIGSFGQWTRAEAAFKCGMDSAVAKNVAAPPGYAAAVAL
ncbi:MAG: hypothetical protein MJ016_03240 [Victivallaceae bacterium]|nr:hypothetical protein [Victivallaceae bacterium]